MAAGSGPDRNSWETSFHLVIDVATFLLAIMGATLRNVMASGQVSENSVSVFA